MRDLKKWYEISIEDPALLHRVISWSVERSL